MYYCIWCSALVVVVWNWVVNCVHCVKVTVRLSNLHTVHRLLSRTVTFTQCTQFTTQLHTTTTSAEHHMQ